MTARQENPSHIFNVLQNLDENALTIGFARRFATYKRAHLLFTNIERLKRLLVSSERPVQFCLPEKHTHRTKQDRTSLNELSNYRVCPNLWVKFCLWRTTI
jgi:hypothetical protein